MSENPQYTQKLMRPIPGGPGGHQVVQSGSQSRLRGFTCQVIRYSWARQGQGSPPGGQNARSLTVRPSQPQPGMSVLIRTPNGSHIGLCLASQELLTLRNPLNAPVRPLGRVGDPLDHPKVAV